MKKGKIFNLYTTRSKRRLGLFSLFETEQKIDSETQHVEQQTLSKSVSSKDVIKEFDKIYDLGEPVPKALCKEMPQLIQPEKSPNQFTVSQSLPNFFVEPFQLDENETENLGLSDHNTQSDKIIDSAPNHMIQEQINQQDRIEENSLPDQLIELDQDSNAQFEQDLKEIISKQEQKKKNSSDHVNENNEVAPSKPVGNRNRIKTDGKNEHAIFDKIAQSMRYANAYDLGEVILDNKFDQFDEELEDKSIADSSEAVSVESLEKVSNEIYQPMEMPEIESPNLPISTTKSASTQDCSLINRIVDIANEEWENWHPNGIKLKESAPKVREYIEGYWRDGVQISNWQYMANESIRDKKPWSSAFVSWVFRLAGVKSEHGFKFSIRHMDYIAEALRNRGHNKTEKPFWLYDINDTSITPQVGDIICKNRGENYSYNILKNRYFDNGNHRITDTTGASHGDIVTEINGNELIAIGGNVGHTVAKSKFRLDSNNRIINPSNHKIFGIVRLIDCESISNDQLPENIENIRKVLEELIKSVHSFLVNLNLESEELKQDVLIEAQKVYSPSIKSIDDITNLIFRMDLFVMMPQYFSISGKPNYCRKQSAYFDSSDQKIHFCPTYKVGDEDLKNNFLMVLCEMVLNSRTSNLSSDSFSLTSSLKTTNNNEARKLAEFINYISRFSNHNHE